MTNIMIPLKTKSMQENCKKQPFQIPSFFTGQCIQIYCIRFKFHSMIEAYKINQSDRTSLQASATTVCRSYGYSTRSPSQTTKSTNQIVPLSRHQPPQCVGHMGTALGALHRLQNQPIRSYLSPGVSHHSV